MILGSYTLETFSVIACISSGLRNKISTIILSLLAVKFRLNCFLNTTFTALLYAKVDYEKVHFMNIKNVHKKVYEKYYGC